MGSFSDYTEDKVLDHIVGKTSFTMPTCYVAFSTADPLDDASGMAEPAGSNYARITTTGGNWNASSGGSISNSADLTTPTASGAWGTLTHVALYDALSGGNLLAHGALDVSKAVTSGDTLTYAGGTPGALVLTLA